MNSLRRDRINKRTIYLLTHPGAKEKERDTEMLAQTLCVLGVHLEHGTWPSRKWMLSEANLPSFLNRETL